MEPIVEKKLYELINRIVKNHTPLAMILSRIKVRVGGRDKYTLGLCKEREIILSRCLFDDEIVYPRLVFIKDPDTGEIVDYDIEDYVTKIDDEERYHTLLEEIIHAGLMHPMRVDRFQKTYQELFEKNKRLVNFLYLCLEVERHAIHTAVANLDLLKPVFKDNTRDEKIVEFIKVIQHDHPDQKLFGFTFERLFLKYLNDFEGGKIAAPAIYDLMEYDGNTVPDKFIEAIEKSLHKGKKYGNQTLDEIFEIRRVDQKGLQLTQLLKQICFRRARKKPSLHVLDKKRKHYEPLRFGKIKEKTSNIAIILDVSGSMFRDFKKHRLIDIATSMIVETFKNTPNIDVYIGDTEIKDKAKIRTLFSRFKGGGGTDMSNIYKQLKDRYQKILVVTDGETPFPEPKDYRTQDIFIIINDKMPEVPNYIKTLKVKL